MLLNVYRFDYNYLMETTSLITQAQQLSFSHLANDVPFHDANHIHSEGKQRADQSGEISGQRKTQGLWRSKSWH